MTRRALILFAKFPRPGEVKTRLGKSIGMEKACDVYREFAKHAFALADAVRFDGVDVYLHYAPGATELEVKDWVDRPFIFSEQKGSDLGERMKNAFDKTFRDGATQSIIIGTDVPDLTVDILHAAFENLATHDIVVGPSTDGGYYLLGMRAPTKDLFEGIHWSTPTVLERTLQHIQEQHLTNTLLLELPDIDTPEDYQAYLRRSERHSP